jgi:16S rRNA (guanine1516-N2)-methyltransferase
MRVLLIQLKIRAVLDLHLQPPIAVTYQSLALRAQALKLAGELKLPLIAAPGDGNYAFLLVFTPQRLELRQQDLVDMGPIYADFISGAVAYRRRFGGGRRQSIAKAVGLKGDANLRVLDATAGLGRDAFILACLGCSVHMVERSPIIAALLGHGLEQARQDSEIGFLVQQRLQLSVADSHTVMAKLTKVQKPDVVYLDPMYPQRTKTALVKKEMRALRRIVGEDQDASLLLATALHCARQRVVVKRPSHAPALEGPKPSMWIKSKNTRFDVYFCRRSLTLSPRDDDHKRQETFS